MYSHLLKSGASVGSTHKSQLQPSHLISVDSSCRHWREIGSFYRQWGQQVNSLLRNSLKRLSSTQSTSGIQLGQAEVGLSKCPPSPPFYLHSPHSPLLPLTYVFTYLLFSHFNTVPLQHCHSVLFQIAPCQRGNETVQ